MSFFRFFASVLAALCLSGAAHAEQGVTADSVRFAQVAALEGPASALGQGMRKGIRAAFEEANRSGGVHGRMVLLDSFDDGYEPERSTAETRDIIANDVHIGLIGPVGTPTCLVTQPLATEAGMPFIGPFTGAGFLRDPVLDSVVNIRATYAAEAEAWIEYLFDGLGMESITVLYQDDGSGRVGLVGVTAALEKRGIPLAATGTYQRNTSAVRSALLQIRRASPDAVVMVGAYEPITEFIMQSRELGFRPAFVTISFVGSEPLAEALGPYGEGVIISQVVPFPWEASLPIVAEYQTALSALDPAARPSFITLEGYLVGRVALRALSAAGPDLDRGAFMAALKSLGSFDMGGLGFYYGEGDNQGLDAIFLTRITRSGTFETVPRPQKPRD